jgi:hypothetical protein
VFGVAMNREQRPQNAHSCRLRQKSSTGKAHAPMAGTRYSNVLKHLIIDLPKQIHVDVVGLEGVSILAKTDSH